MSRNPDSAGRPRALTRRRLVAAALTVPAVAAALWFALPWVVPWPEALDEPPAESVRITDRHGTPLRRLLADGMRSGAPLPFDRIPKALVQATLAAEDRRFFSHDGIDFAATLRAARDSLTAGRTVSGASTVTQQLAKLARPGPRTFLTKLREALTARRIEMTWSKERILEAYLNRLDYGNLHRGPSAAAAGYFAKPLGDCSLAECAFLAALPQAPSRLNPWRHFDAARARQQWILQRMADLGWIDADDFRRAADEPLVLRRYFGEFQAPHFVDLLLRQRPDDFPDGGSLTTSLDLTIQRVCEQTVENHLSRLEDRRIGQAAVVVLDSATSEVLALTGSRDYDGPAGQVNGATARRSPGSALKPFTYLLALQDGCEPATIVPDLPVEFMTPTGIYRPQNYDRRAAGPVSLRNALANSLNIGAVRVLQDHGGAEALVAALQAAGISTLTRPPDDYGLGLTIGGGEVTLLELTAAYACLARMGTYLPPALEPRADPHSGPQVFDPLACWLLADILSDNDARIRAFGQVSALRFPFPAAIKTGTSTDYRDNWTIAYTPRFTVGVWAGNFDNTPMRGVSGVSGAAPILHDILEWLESESPGPWFPRPAEILTIPVDPLTGRPVPPQWQQMRPTVREKFRRGNAPDGPGTDCYDAAGRVVLPADYGPWLAGPDNWLGSSAVARSSPPADAPWHIVRPLPGTVLYLDPDLPGGGSRLPLAAGPAPPPLEWLSPTLRIEGAVARLTEGRHTLVARDPATGREEETWILVRKL